MMIRVLLAEDQAMVRGALAALLSREQDIKVVAEVARGDEVVEAALASDAAAICAGPWRAVPWGFCSRMRLPRN